MQHQFVSLRWLLGKPYDSAAVVDEATNFTSSLLWVRSHHFEQPQTPLLNQFGSYMSLVYSTERRPGIMVIRRN